METIDIQNRAFVVRWVKCFHGDTINYQVKPLKKSIDLGIYKKLKKNIDEQPSTVHIAPDTKTALDFANKAVIHRNNSISSHVESNESHSRSSLSISNIQQQSQEKPLRDRLAASGFTLVKWIGHIQGNKMYQDVVDVMDSDYYYAFILDNTASKNAKKKVLFNASIIQEDAQSLNSINSSSSPMLNSIQTSNTQQDSVFVVGQGRYIQGYLLKKRRKRLQGFKRRFFTLDFRYGTLSYHLNDHNQTRRGEIVIKLSTVSANKKDRLIIIDSGMEIWALKAKDVTSWQTWVKALQSCFEKDESSDNSLQSGSDNECTIVSDNDVTTDNPSRISNNNADGLNNTSLLSRNSTSSYTPLPTEAYEDFSVNLKIIEQRLEQYKNDSLSYTPIEQEYLINEMGNSYSASSSLHGYGGIKSMSRTSLMDSTDSLQYPSDSAIPETISEEHQLYHNLAELESLFHQFVKQSRVLYHDHNLVTKQINGKRLSMASSLSENENFFDAEDYTNVGVILIDDEDAVDTNTKFITNLHGFSSTEFEGTETISSSHKFIQEKKGIQNLDTAFATIKSVGPKLDIENDDLFPLPIAKKVERRNDVKAQLSSPPSLISFLRKNVGKDLSSITMPVTSNEPISILQTIAESFEYANTLQQLSDLSSPFEPLATVSAFAISALSIYRERTRSLRKPFNPLLGETYELVREDMGFRLISEKVCHKPQIFAFYADHEDWECSYTVIPEQKFWGKSIELNNAGTFELKSKKTGEYFEWVQPTTIVKNLIAGGRYVEPSNEIEVISSKSGKATISFEKTGMFSGRSENVTVNITSTNKNRKVPGLVGKWTESLKDTGSNNIIWRVGELVKSPKSKYGFTKFAANLNQITSIEENKLPPTDSRLRPDIRFYEDGKIDEAENYKLKLEQSQRERRLNNKDVRPRYFEKNSANKWDFIKGPNSYWEKRKRQDWSDAPTLW